MINSNPLYDREFLYELSHQKEREIYARIISLTQDELPLESIEGKVTTGSINVDGASAVRRTCSLTIVAANVNINDFYWGLNTKFKLEIGLLNKINSKYPNVIWFKQGLYVITSFSTQQGINNFTINISGKDKMCLLNGDISGKLPHTTDFGIIEEWDNNDHVIFTSIPIKTIIREAMQNFGNEPARNIIINDIEDAGVEMLEYRGDTILYLLRDTVSDIFTNMTIRGEQPCFYIDDEGISHSITFNTIPRYDNLVNLENTNNPTIITLTENSNNKYTVANIDYGNVPGYRLTDLTYAGDLIANVGETLTSVLDKIKNMLGDYEYFYDIDGRFVFQKKRNYIKAPSDFFEQSNDNKYQDVAINTNVPIFSFIGNDLVTAVSNTPNLLNLKNDYAVWGKKKMTSGAEIPIHVRYAIDVKPYYYKNSEGIVYTTREDIEGNKVDWREIIYQMAIDYRAGYYTKDDFFIDLQNNNIIDGQYLYEGGRTGYEQYYTDMEGFWRDIYYPDENGEYKWVDTVVENPESLVFWFDFLDTDLEHFNVKSVGIRSEAVNDNDVTAIYYREIPNVIFKSPDEKEYEKKTGYTYVNLQSYMENLFTISKTRKSAWDKISELLYKHSYCIENTSITAIPIYYLEPNTRIYIRDEKSNIDGEYIVSKFTIPLTYNGTMSITASKAVESIV